MSNTANMKFSAMRYQSWVLLLLALLLSLGQPALAAKDNNARSVTVSFNDPFNDTAHSMAIGYATLAEIAWDREFYGEALAYYMHAMDSYPDVQIAARLTELSLMAEALEPALKASSLWAKLAPENNHAQSVAATLQLKAGLTKQASQRLSQLLSNNEEFSQAVLMINSQMQTQQEQLRLLQIIEHLLTQHPKHAELLFSSALLATNQQQYDKAELNIRQALAQRPDWVQAIGLHIQILRDTNQNDQAMKYIKQALQQFPKLHQVRLLYGQILSEQKAYAAAQDEFNQLVQHQEFKLDAHTNLAIIALEQHLPTNAYTHLQEVLALDPANDAAFYYLGELAEQNKDHQSAMNWYNSVRLGNYHLSAQIKAAKLMAQAGDLAQALKQIHALMMTYPQYNKHLTISSVQMLVEHQKADKALVILNEAVENAPRDLDLLYARSLVAAHLQNFKQTEADLKLVLSIDPDHFDALNALGFTLADQTERYDEAMQYIQKAMMISPENPSVIDSMGWLLYRLGDYEKSIAHLERAFALSGDGEIAAHLGEVLWVYGQKDAAIKTWQTALEGSPNHEVLLEVYQRFVEPN